MAVFALWVAGSRWAGPGAEPLAERPGRVAARAECRAGTTNDGYRTDIAVVSSGAAAEEEARKNGYARSNEKLYVLTTPPPATPAPSPARKPKR